MNKTIIKDTLALFVITIVAGIFLGLVYEITKEPIATQNAIRKEKAYKEVMGTASSFKEYSLDEKDVTEFLTKEGYDASIDEVMVALDSSDEEIGHVLTVTSHEGYGGDITFAMGITSDGTVKGISMLSISETAGLGMKAKEEEFTNQFKDKNVELFTYTKSGSSSDSEIDALSGATITTNAVTNGVNAGKAYISYIGGEDDE